MESNVTWWLDLTTMLVATFVTLLTYVKLLTLLTFLALVACDTCNTCDTCEILYLICWFCLSKKGVMMMMLTMEKRESIRGVHGRGGSHYCCLERDSPASWHLPFLDHAHDEDPFSIGRIHLSRKCSFWTPVTGYNLNVKEPNFYVIAIFISVSQHRTQGTPCGAQRLVDL